MISKLFAGLAESFGMASSSQSQSFDNDAHDDEIRIQQIRSIKKNPQNRLSFVQNNINSNSKLQNGSNNTRATAPCDKLRLIKQRVNEKKKTMSISPNKTQTIEIKEETKTQDQKNSNNKHTKKFSTNDVKLINQNSEVKSRSTNKPLYPETKTGSKLYQKRNSDAPVQPKNLNFNKTNVINDNNQLNQKGKQNSTSHINSNKVTPKNINLNSYNNRRNTPVKSFLVNQNNDTKFHMEQIVSNCDIYQSFEKCLSPRSSSFKLNPLLRECKNGLNERFDTQNILPETLYDGNDPIYFDNNNFDQIDVNINLRQSSPHLKNKSQLKQHQNANSSQQNLGNGTSCTQESGGILTEEEMNTIRNLQPKQLIESFQQQNQEGIKSPKSSIIYQSNKKLKKQCGMNINHDKQKSPLNNNSKSSIYSNKNNSLSIKTEKPQHGNKLAIQQLEEIQLYKDKSNFQLEEEQKQVNASYYNKNTTINTTSTFSIGKIDDKKYSQQQQLSQNNNKKVLDNSCIYEVSKGLEESPKKSIQIVENDECQQNDTSKIISPIMHYQHQSDNKLIQMQKPLRNNNNYNGVEQNTISRQNNRVNMSATRDSHIYLRKTSTQNYIDRQNNNDNYEDDAVSVIFPSNKSTFSYEPKYFKPNRRSFNETSQIKHQQSLQSGNNSPMNNSILNTQLDVLLNNVNFVIPGGNAGQNRTSYNILRNGINNHALSQRVSDVNLGSLKMDNFSQANDEMAMKSSKYMEQLKLLKQSKPQKQINNNQQNQNTILQQSIIDNNNNNNINVNTLLNNSNNITTNHSTQINMFVGCGSGSGRQSSQNSSPLRSSIIISQEKQYTKLRNTQIEQVSNRKIHQQQKGVNEQLSRKQIIVKSQAVSRKNSLSTSKQMTNF